MSRDSLAHAVPLGAGRAATAWAELWPRFDQSIDRFLVALEQRTGPRGAGGMTRRELERARARAAGGPGARTVGAPAGDSARLAEQLERAAASNAERLVLDLTVRGSALGRLRAAGLPAPGPRACRRRRLAARLLLRSSVVTRSPPLSGPEADVGMWLAERALRRRARKRRLGDDKVLHDRIGWAVFLQELSSLPGVPERDLSASPPRPGHTRRGRLARALGILRALRDGDDPWLPVEVGRELPMPPPGAEAVRVVPSLGGVPLGVVSLRLSPGDGRARLRPRSPPPAGSSSLAWPCARRSSAARSTPGRCANGSPRSPARALRPRRARHQDPARRHLPSPARALLSPRRARRGGSALVLARQDPGVIGTSTSRRAVLPAAARPAERRGGGPHEARAFAWPAPTPSGCSTCPSCRGRGGTGGTYHDGLGTRRGPHRAAHRA